MKLKSLTKEQCEQVRVWRNQDMACWRTPYPLTERQQQDFYENIVCKRNSPNRYWAVIGEIRKCNQISCEEWTESTKFIGMGGITTIQWENRIGEITLVIDPALRGKGCGEKAVELVLDQAFNSLNLKTVWSECYGCNEKGCGFWQSIAAKYNSFTTAIPNRKFWNGEFYNSLYFSIDAEDFRKK